VKLSASHPIKPETATVMLRLWYRGTRSDPARLHRAVPVLPDHAVAAGNTVGHPPRPRDEVAGGGRSQTPRDSTLRVACVVTADLKPYERRVEPARLSFDAFRNRLLQELDERDGAFHEDGSGKTCDASTRAEGDRRNARCS